MYNARAMATLSHSGRPYRNGRALALLPIALLLAAPASAGEGSAEMDTRTLAAHNAARSAVGVPPLRWNAGLAEAARAWAEELAKRGKLQHSDRMTRKGISESLWLGSTRQASPEAMVGGFVSESRYFRPGAFPHVSRTGNWLDVSHYTQIIWPDTREVGCATATTSGKTVLVCRYFPKGNQDGVFVGPVALASGPQRTDQSAN